MPETPPEVVVPLPNVPTPPDVTIDTGGPNEVEGKEQQKAPVPKQQEVVETGNTLPFSGLELVWVAALGVGLVAAGAACRRSFA